MGIEQEETPVRAPMSHDAIAELFTARGEPITRGGVWVVERRALAKIAQDPVLRLMAAELGLAVPAFPQSSITDHQSQILP